MLVLAVAALITASSSPRQAVIALGDCRDPDLVSVTRDLTGALAANGAVLPSPDEISDELAPASSRSIEELQRQLEAAQNEFYAGEMQKAEQALKTALTDIDKLPPSVAHFNLLATANLTYALLLKGTGRGAQADELFSQVLRLAPAYRMDPDYYSPGTRARFERIRRGLAAQGKKRLTVKSTPLGVEVNLDGKPVGHTPLTIDLPSGTYVLRLAKEGALSFPHPVQLNEDRTENVDFAFESSVDAERVPCVQQAADVRDVNGAARLANVLGAENAVVLRIDRAQTGPRWLTATLFSLPAGQKVREGSLKWERPNHAPDGLADLVTFLTTGEAAGKVVALKTDFAARTELAPKPAPVAAASPAPAPPVTTSRPELPPFASPPAALTPPPLPATSPAVVTERASSPMSGRQTAGLAMGGAGAVAVIAGALFDLKAHSEWNAFDSYYADGGAPNANEIADAANLRDSARSKQTLGTAMLIGGAVLGGAGAYLYFTAPKRSGLAARLSIGASGAALTIVTP
jgi:hypothetical protein